MSSKIEGGSGHGLNIDVASFPPVDAVIRLTGNDLGFEIDFVNTKRTFPPAIVFFLSELPSWGSVHLKWSGVHVPNFLFISMQCGALWCDMVPN